jgi:hypothetical protein
MTVGGLILEGIVCHPLPLQYIFLGQHLVLEGRSAIEVGNSREDKDGDEMRERA